MVAVHQRWDKRPAISLVESGTHQDHDAEFKLGGELYKLELRQGTRVPMKVHPDRKKKPGEFKGKCFKCDRRGHVSKDCTHTSTADDSPLNARKKDLHNVEANQEPEEVDAGGIDLNYFDIDLDIDAFEVVGSSQPDPWTHSDP